MIDLKALTLDSRNGDGPVHFVGEASDFGPTPPWRRAAPPVSLTVDVKTRSGEVVACELKAREERDGDVILWDFWPRDLARRAEFVVRIFND